MVKGITRKRITAAVLALLAVISAVSAAVPLNAEAASLDVMGSPSVYHMESSMVSAGVIYGKYTNDGINHYGINIHSLNNYPAYCIEYTKKEPVENSQLWNMGNTAGDFIGNAVQTQMVYGLAETIDQGTLGSNPTPGLTENHKKRILLQLLIYEIQIGYLIWDSDRGIIVENTSFSKQTRDVHTYWISNTYGLTSGDTWYYAYINENTPYSVRERLSTHMVNPGTIPLTYDKTTQLYTACVPDSTAYLIYFDAELASMSLNDGAGAFVTLTRDGNNMQVTVSKKGYEKYFTRSGGKGTLSLPGAAQATRTLYMNTGAPGHAPVSSFTRYGGSDTTYQQLLTVQPATGREAVVGMSPFTLTAEDAEPTGTVTVTKTSEDGIVYGLSFKLSGANGGNIYNAVKSTNINGKAVFTEVPYGNYTLTEAANPLYKDFSAAVTVSDASTDVALNAHNSIIRGDIEITKTDSSRGRAAQGDASLAGIKYAITAATAGRTKDGKAFSPGQVVAEITTNAEGVAKTGGGLLPYGTYKVTEADTGSSGYARDPDWYYTFSVSSSDDADRDGISVYRCTQQDDPVKGGIDIVKTDSATGTSVTSGDCSLEGALFDILNGSAAPVLVNGALFSPGDTVMTVSTDKTGCASTGMVLPYGTYEVREKSAPEGYLINASAQTVKIRSASAETVRFEDDPVRYSLAFKKIDAETLEGLGNVVFRISLLNPDGSVRESHLAVTDAEGWFDSANLLGRGSFAALNANDEADGKTGLDETLINANAPVRFSGTGNGTQTVKSRSEGAFPYGTYRIEELRCAGNSRGTSSTGKQYIVNEAFTLEMHLPAGNMNVRGEYEAYSYNLVIDNTDPPELSTFLAEEETGFKEPVPGKGLRITDRIELTGLQKGSAYVLNGKLMDKETAQPAADDSGEEITVRKEFTAEKEDMTLNLTYAFDGENAGDSAYVSFVQLEKKLSDGSTVTVQTDADLNNADETVIFLIPLIRTSAAASDGSGEVKAGFSSSVTDTVSYESLVPGAEYTLTGRLWDKAGECFVKDSEGNDVAASAAFTPEASGGEVKLDIIFDGTLYQGAELVVFERLYRSGVLVAAHEDPEDEAQTVTVERHWLTKIDASTGEGLPGARIRIMDRTSGTVTESVSDETGRVYFSLIPGHAYSWQELEAPEGYIRDSSIYSFEADGDGGTDCELVIRNIKSGSVVISKTDALSGMPVENAEISVYAASDTELKEPLFVQKTDRLGQICFDPSGYLEGAEAAVTFLFKETAAPKGYYLETDVMSFSIAPDGKVTGTTAFVDVPVGTVAIRKTDENGAVLPGAKLSVYTEKGKLAGQAATGSTGRIYFTPDEPGSYYFVEDEAPKGYVRDTAKHSFSISADGIITNEYGKNEAVVLKNAKQPSGATGDSRHAEAAVFIAAVCFAAAGAVWLISAKGRKKKGKHAG